MIGNDIIDLSLAKTASNWQRKGFLEKQFTANEQQLVLEAPNSFVMVWRLWSMKEAAYKIYTQQHIVRFFAPKKFECKLRSAKEGVVCFKGQKFYTGAIVLTFRQRSGVKRQSYFSQISRERSDGVELIDVPSNQGVKSDD